MTIEQAWSAQLILLEGFWRSSRAKFEKDPYAIGIHIATLNTDFECYDEWCTRCRNFFIEKSAEEMLFSPDDAFRMVIEYTSHFRDHLGFEISKLLDLVKAMQADPEACREELELWNQAVQRVIDGERRGSELKFIGPRFGDIELYMGNMPLLPDESWQATYIFLQDIWEKYGKNFEDQEVGLRAFLVFFNGRFEKDYTWRREYVNFMGKQFLSKDKVFPDQIFSIMIRVLSRHQNKYGFEMADVLRLFRSMQEMPANHKEEWQLWRNAWERAKAGEIR